MPHPLPHSDVHLLRRRAHGQPTRPADHNNRDLVQRLHGRGGRQQLRGLRPVPDMRVRQPRRPHRHRHLARGAHHPYAARVLVHRHYDADQDCFPAAVRVPAVSGVVSSRGDYVYAAAAYVDGYRC